MRYEDMPKGRNKDRCVRCGKRYNFADKALSKAKVPYDLLCLAEVTTSGYMTHGNVKLCDECMVELLMWLDRKTEPTTEDCSTVDKDINVRSKDEPKLVKESVEVAKDLVKAFCEDGTWLERQGVYTLTLAEAKQRAVDIIESVMAKDEQSGKE